jgi:hypothetical protein
MTENLLTEFELKLTTKEQEKVARTSRLQYTKYSAVMMVCICSIVSFIQLTQLNVLAWIEAIDYAIGIHSAKIN